MIVNQDGETVAWTRDPRVGQVIGKLLNENLDLLYTNRKGELK